MSLSSSSEVAYARTPGGTYLAYQEFGDGEPLLYLSDGFIPIEYMDDEPRLVNAMRRLASFARVIRFDRRGVGGSDPVANPEAAPMLDQWVVDATAVLDATGQRSAWVMAPADAGLIALTLAAMHPTRVRGLVLWNAYARYLASDDHPSGYSPRQAEDVRTSTTVPEAGESEFDLLQMIAPSVAEELAFRAWWDRVGRRGASPGTAQAFRRVIEHTDVRALLSTVGTPVLLLHRPASKDISPGQSVYLERHLPNARLVALDGEDSLWWVTDQQSVLDEVQLFVTGRRPEPRRGSPFLTVLFTDIVDSTPLAAMMGDQVWTTTLEQYFHTARREVTLAGGVYTRDTGDGILAWFEEPTRALACAVRLRDAASDIGLTTRTGLHAGEVQLRGNDLFGVNVHIASRVQAMAAGGEVLVTRPIVDLARQSGLSFQDRGMHPLKGVADERQIFEFLG